jgi:hypothetical protein
MHASVKTASAAPSATRLRPGNPRALFVICSGRRSLGGQPATTAVEKGGRFRLPDSPRASRSEAARSGPDTSEAEGCVGKRPRKRCYGSSSTTFSLCALLLLLFVTMAWRPRVRVVTERGGARRPLPRRSSRGNRPGRAPRQTAGAFSLATGSRSCGVFIASTYIAWPSTSTAFFSFAPRWPWAARVRVDSLLVAGHRAALSVLETKPLPHAQASPRYSVVAARDLGGRGIPRVPRRGSAHETLRR